MQQKVRVRFAPSPTGLLHIGGVRTALFNYLFAKKHKGDFLLRIEDTDQTRFMEGAEEYILESLKWCGIEPNEGVHYGGPHAPYRQSERKNLYKKYADELIASGNAYFAFDTPEELDQLRKKGEEEKITFTYDAKTRNQLKNSLALSAQETETLIQQGIPYVIRFKMPAQTDVAFTDMIRGDVVMNTNSLDDKVIFKSDGLPTYHLANIVDDHLMEITHVIRGEEWLPSTPLHILLYRALGWETTRPQFAHVSLILKPDGKGKLSKRDGDRLGFPVFPLQHDNKVTGEFTTGYRENGYLPEAFINFLSLLGWNPGTEQELFTKEELIEAFSLERLHKAGAKFDPDKAKWFNHQYLSRLTDSAMIDLVQPILTKKNIALSSEQLLKIIPLVKERMFFPADIIEQAGFFFNAPATYDDKTVKKCWKETTPALMQQLKQLINKQDDYTASQLEHTIKDFLHTNEIGMGQAFTPLRLLMVGAGAGPDLFMILEILGKEEVLLRIEKGLSILT